MTINPHQLPGIQPDWLAPANVKAFTATRDLHQGEFSLGVRAEGCDPQQGRDNRLWLKQQVGWQHEPQWLKQVHGADVVVAKGDHSEPEADACWTAEAGQPCTAMTADCLPVLFCDQAGSRVAAAHAGWRGLAGGVLENTIQSMGCEPRQLMAWMGPAIASCHFEVGSEVRAAFITRHDQTEPAFTPSTRSGHWMADLYQIARIRLEAAGVTQVYGGEYCTYCDKEKFFSYRRGQESGRMASFIWIDPV
ncbi:peptidoglycan editing factor PgeF [Endozoicomonadaceae bacterium StTr2]